MVSSAFRVSCNCIVGLSLNGVHRGIRISTVRRIVLKNTAPEVTARNVTVDTILNVFGQSLEGRNGASAPNLHGCLRSDFLFLIDSPWSDNLCAL